MHSNNTTGMDWTLCAICQKSTSEPLSCPQHSANRYDPLNVYKGFIENVVEFEKLNVLSVKCSIGLAGASDRSVESCMVNKASWHRLCHQKFNNSKLQRENNRKRKLETETDNGKDTADTEIRQSKRQSIDSSTEKKIFAISAIRKMGSFMNIAHFLQTTQTLEAF